jgi:hypothetical protein
MILVGVALLHEFIRTDRVNFNVYKLCPMTLKPKATALELLEET